MDALDLDVQELKLALDLVASWQLEKILQQPLRVEWSYQDYPHHKHGTEDPLFNPEEYEFINMGTASFQDVKPEVVVEYHYGEITSFTYQMEEMDGRYYLLTWAQEEEGNLCTFWSEIHEDDDYNQVHCHSGLIDCVSQEPIAFSITS